MKQINVRLGFLLVGTLFLVALLAPLLSPHDPTLFHLEDQFHLPHGSYLFGQDNFGRCVLSRVFYGTRISLSIGVLVVVANLLVGMTLGLVAGWRGGWFDTFFLFITDVFMAFPGFLLAIAIAAFIGPSVLNVVFILSFLGWVSYARLARGQVLSFKEQEFVLASKSLGASPFRLLFRHVVPNVMGPMVVQATFGMAGVILIESSLSFLGLGIPVDLPSWGNMLDQGTQYLLIAPHLSIFPGIFIMLIVLGFNFLGDGLRDKLDPKGALKT